MPYCIQTPLLIALFTTLLITANVNAEQNDPIDEWPAWVQDAMKKESRKIKLRAVKTPDDKFNTKLPGKRSKPEAMENGWYFKSDFRAESPLECYIFTTAMDLASLTSQIAENNIDAIATTHGTVGDRRIFHTEAGAIAGMPYLALEWLYTVTGESQTLVGFTKVRAATKGDVAYVCAHNYLGYRETFAKAFSGFVENVEYENTTPPPYYEEIATLDFNGFGSGIAYAAFSADEDGDIKMYAVEASITPVNAGTLQTSDSVTITYTTPEGELINTVSVSVENGEIANNLSLRANDASNWVSSGTMRGKPIEVELDGAVSPATPLAQMAITRELFASTESSASMDVWIPNADPTRFLKAEIVRDDGETKGKANLTIGPLKYSGLFDEYGNMIEAEMFVGPLTINIERAWSRGSLLR